MSSQKCPLFTGIAIFEDVQAGKKVFLKSQFHIVLAKRHEEGVDDCFVPHTALNHVLKGVVLKSYIGTRYCITI